MYTIKSSNPTLYIESLFIFHEREDTSGLQLWLYYYSPGFPVANVVSKKYAVPLVTRRGVPGHH